MIAAAPRQPEFVIITGLSGAGKSWAIKCFEDIGFFCVDNLPSVLIPKFAELVHQSGDAARRAAIVVDVREMDFFRQVFEALREIEERGVTYRILFLDATEEILMRRFSETRRPHPLAVNGETAEAAIGKERILLEEFRGRADIIMDTSDMSAKDLKDEITRVFVTSNEEHQLTVSLISFGYKYGVPRNSDIALDVRFLPNPYYMETLAQLTGDDEPVVDYLNKWPLTKKFKEHFYTLIEFLIPQYIREGKTYLTIGIGCTGGRHRSVVLVNDLCQFIQEAFRDVSTVKSHRDIGK